MAEKWLAKLRPFLKTNRLIVLGIAGMVLIGLSSLISPGESKEPSNTSSAVNTQEYAENLEEQLENLLSRITGAGKCRVMITMEQGTEYVYATEERNTADVSQTSECERYSTGSRSTDEQTYIMISTDQGDQPLLLTELAPRVKGVVVVTPGADDPAVVEQIQTALATALDITAGRICVVEGN